MLCLDNDANQVEVNFWRQPAKHDRQRALNMAFYDAHAETRQKTYQPFMFWSYTNAYGGAWLYSGNGGFDPDPLWRPWYGNFPLTGY